MARIINFSGVPWSQGLLPLEFCLLALNELYFKANIKRSSSQSSNISEYATVNRKSNTVRNKCGRFLTLQHQSTFDLTVWIFRAIWQEKICRH